MKHPNVHACMKEFHHYDEPFFTLNVMMELNDVNKLRTYEDYLHKQGHDTMNRTKAKGKK